MDLETTVITFTPMELFQAVLAVCGAITAVAAAVAVVASLIKKAKAPNQLQNDRLKALEEGQKNHRELLDKDNRRLQDIEEGNRITQKALLALLSHGIDGNDVDGMRKAKEELQRYLINK